LPGEFGEQVTWCRQHLPKIEHNDELTVPGAFHALNVSIIAGQQLVDAVCCASMSFAGAIRAASTALQVPE
jgi:hypothetical protein